MIRKLNKIACITISIFLIMLSPIGSYIQGENAKAYAVGTEIENAMAEFMFPIVAYIASQQLQNNGAYDSVEATVQDIANIIDTLNDSKSMYLDYLSINAKVKLAKLYTDLSDYDINKMFGTTFSSAQMQEMTTEVDNIKAKIANDSPLTNSDIYGLGVHSILAKYIDTKFKTDESVISNIPTNSNIYENVVSGETYLEYKSPASNVIFRMASGYYDNSDFIRFIGGTYKYYLYSLNSGSLTTINGVSSYNFGYKDFYFKMNLSNQYYLFSESVNSTSSSEFYASQNSKIVDMSKVFVKDIYGPYFYIKDVNGNTVSSLRLYNNTTVIKFLDWIKPYTSANIVNSDYYVNSTNYNLLTLLNITRLGYRSYISPTIYLGQNKISSLLSTVIDPAISVPDTTLGQAEKVIASQSQDPTITYDNNVEAIPKGEIGDSDIVISPPTVDGIPSTSTGDYPTTVDPDTGAVVNEDGKAFNIPILGTLLSWLVKIWNMLKSIFDTITQFFTNSGTANEGIDWGNFKGLFDIFYIFYYLIIIVIMILLKFLAVVFNMLSIPANSSLFANYPTMLAGLNYIKNIKVGGFNITLQQIFEYMFTVFFFLFIVTTLQKLYHSFAGIERQTINQEQKWENNSNVIYRDGNYVNTKTGEIQDYKYK